MEQSTARTTSRSRHLDFSSTFGYAAMAAALLLLAVLFAMLPLPGADDWRIFHGAAQMVAAGQIPYGIKIGTGYYFNLPWLAMLLVPLGTLSFRLSYGLMMAISIGVIFLLCRRWKMGPVKLAAVLLSPPMFYTILHGNIDAFVLGAVLLPKEFWLVASVVKPQTIIALALGALDSKWSRMALISIGVVGLSFLALGNWIPAYLSSPLYIISTGRNLFQHTWPYQIVIGVALAWIGWKRNDELFLIGASPFFSPYAATSSLLGPLMLLIAKRKNWEAVAIVALTWALALWSAIN